MTYSLYVLPRGPSQGAETLSQLPASCSFGLGLSHCHCHHQGLTPQGPGPAPWGRLTFLTTAAEAEGSGDLPVGLEMLTTGFFFTKTYPRASELRKKRLGVGRGGLWSCSHLSLHEIY